MPKMVGYKNKILVSKADMKMDSNRNRNKDNKNLPMTSPRPS